MAVFKPKTIEEIEAFLADNVFINSKLLRKAIDRDKRIQQLAIIPGDYAEKYEELRKATEEMVKEHGDDSRKLVPGTRLQVRSAKRIFGGGGNFRQNKRFLEQIMPEMKESHELGHKNISVLRSNVALALKTMDRQDPRRPKLRALFQTIKELDKIVDQNDIEKVDIHYLLEQVEKTASRQRGFEVDWKLDIELLKGLSGAIELEYEPIGLNQEKGKVSAFLGEMFKDLIQEEGKKIEKLFETIDISGLKGSPDMVQDVLDVLTEAIDPKLKPKKRKRGRNPQKGKIAKQQARKRKTQKLRSPTQKRGRQRKKPFSPLQLIGVLNKQLPQTVRKNMVAPGLENRTGRFASSVRVTDVVQTPQGYPSIGYTYQKNPYEVFEMGGGAAPWSTPERDPRHLIDRSIREIMAQHAIGRFYTRRE